MVFIALITGGGVTPAALDFSFSLLILWKLQRKKNIKRHILELLKVKRFSEDINYQEKFQFQRTSSVSAALNVFLLSVDLFCSL